MRILLVLAFLLLNSCNQKKNSPKVTEPVDPTVKLEEALKKTPSFENHLNLGLALAKSGQGKKALEMYKKAAKINPNAPVAWNNICFESARLGQHLEAIKACNKALALEPSYELAKNNLKYAKDQLKDYKKKLAQEKQNLRKGAKLPSQKIIDLGMNFYDIKDFVSAIEIWGAINPSDKLFAVAQNNIASSSILLGSLRDAELALENALRIDPQNKLYNNNLKWLEDEKKKRR